MAKRKVLIAVHQLNLGGAQKALISSLNAIDYTENEVTLFINKNRTDLLPAVNPNVAKIVVNEDTAKYYNSPFALLLELPIRLLRRFGKDPRRLRDRQVRYIVSRQHRYAYRHYFSGSERYDTAVSYIQGYTAQSVARYVKAEHKVMFFHNSTDDHHALHEEIMRDFEKIVCVSRGAMAALRGFYPQYAEKMVCIENDVDADAVREAAEAFSPGCPADRLTLCSCGRLSREKGFDLAVRAAARLRDTGLPFKWYFVGDGPERGAVEALIAEHALQDRIEITGLQQNPYPYIKNCDIYVQPSYEEAHPLTVIEAQILCRPIVSTATVGGKNLVADGENGLLAEIDAGALAEKILALSGDGDLRARFAAALAQTDHRERRARFARQWAALLNGEEIEV